MKCEPTRLPDEIDIDALKAKYRQERDKRLRKDGQAQYIKLEGEFASYAETDPHIAIVPRAPISEDIEVAIIGAGFTGLLAGVRLKEYGVTDFRFIDAAGDFGGAWYWNHYPGVQCDNDSYCYIPLIEETGYIPSKVFADGPEIYEHCQRIAKKFALYDNSPIFHTWVHSLRWDEKIKRWHIGTNWGDDLRARFVIMGLGPHGMPKLPGVPGIKDFKGRSFHTSRWDYGYTGGSPGNPVLDKLADKRVAVIGTGASAIQVVPYLGRFAKHVYVFQRTPSSVDARNNRSTDIAWVRTLKPGWQQKRRRNYHRAVFERLMRGEPDLVCDFWTEINRNLAASLEEQGWPDLTPEEYAALYEKEDYRVMERLRRRVANIVEDERTAEVLKPYFRFRCKRPCSNDDYLQTFNRPNVTLVDVSSSKGVERVTDKGIVGAGVEYEIDCIIYATGFESGGDLRARMGIDVIEGRNGRSLYDEWANGYKTFHGLMSCGFPNQFHTGFTQTGLSQNLTEMYAQQCHHIAYIIKETMARGATVVEPVGEAQDAWCAIMRETSPDNSEYLRECTPGYFNSEGKPNVKGFLGGELYGPGFAAFDKLLEDWRDNGKMAGLTLSHETEIAREDA